MWLFQREQAAARAKAKAKAAKRRARKQRKRKWPDKPYDPTRVKRVPVTPEQIDTLIALAKGQVPASEGKWFYCQFIPFSHGKAQTPEQVRQFLADAYWVEEDDLRQQVDILRWVLDSKDEVVRDENYRLAQALRIYLTRDEKIFRGDMSHIKAMYQYDINMAQMDKVPEPEKNLDIVFERNTMYSTFDRYVIYLYHCLGQTEKDLAKTLLLGIKSATKIKKDLDAKIKEQSNGQKNTGRHRQPTLAIFTNR